MVRTLFAPTATVHPVQDIPTHWMSPLLRHPICCLDVRSLQFAVGSGRNGVNRERALTQQVFIRHRGVPSTSIEAIYEDLEGFEGFRPRPCGGNTTQIGTLNSLPKRLMRQITHHRLLRVLALSMLLGAMSASAQTYTLTAIPLLPGNIGASPNAINNSGQVTGTTILGGGVNHAFLYSAGTMTTILVCPPQRIAG
jgi:probable HAF family extracellular repeat protein